MKYVKIFLVLLMVPFVSAASCGSNVPGYVDLQLEGDAAVRQSFFEAGAMYEPVQVVFENAVTDPLLPADVKNGIKAADLVVTDALEAYREVIRTAPGNLDIQANRLQLYINALNTAQQLLVQLQTRGIL